ncbi:Protein smg5 [Desmophyllum pertusum]|uniref:Protein smg5 n=1 Tax=Desmophyllum pertusum TaxID=174260 RepID=A0A9W9YFR6_9CNID|nr:Protein smg5 [Desmophyllum pertusum]
MPQNQLGTLAGTKAYGCEGAYFYLRCLLSKEVFEGAEGNLLRIFEKNRSILHRIKELPLDEPRPKERLKRFLVYFLYLQDVLYQHENSPEISSEDTGHLCQSVLQDFSSVLSVDPASSSASKPSLENGIASQENGGMEHDVTDDMDSVISSSLMVKLVVMAIATVTRLQSRGSQESSVATAFTLALLSLLLQNCISSFENFLTKEHSSTDQPVANGPANAALSHNGLSADKLSKHEDSVTGSKAQSNLNQAKKVKKVLKHRRRRRRRRNIDYSFESYSGSGSDLDESGDDEDEDSDLSEGGGEHDGMLDDLMSEEEDSEDVYIESDSDNESGNTTGSLPNTVFSTANGKQHENEAFPKSTEKLPPVIKPYKTSLDTRLDT